VGVIVNEDHQQHEKDIDQRRDIDVGFGKYPPLLFFMVFSVASS